MPQTNSGIVVQEFWTHLSDLSAAVGFIFVILRPWSLSARLLHNQAVGVGEAPAKTPGTKVLWLSGISGAVEAISYISLS